MRQRKSCQPLTEALVRRHAKAHTLFVTFTNAASSMFAANWAKQLNAISLSGLVGVVEDLRPDHISAIEGAGSGLFCGSGELMRRNGQAGRWAEVAPLLRFGLNVLISDADITWFRDPRPYFRELRRVHPHLDFLLCTDRAFNGYRLKPLLQPRTAGAVGGSGAHAARETALVNDLDLEDGEGASIPSYNIGILMLYSHASANLSAMIDVLWVRAVQMIEYEPPSRRDPKAPRRAKPMTHGLSRWDQGPINAHVLRGRRHPKDPLLVQIDRPLVRESDGPYAALDRNFRGPRVKVGMGVLPMLQFTTAYTYFIQADLREHTQARPYSMHAIYTHGGGAEKKVALMRDAQGWHDPPEYYADRGRKYLTYDSSPAERLQRHGGFEIIYTQLRRFELALQLASLANRTLIMPRLRCGNQPMAYPCYAWYHRATTSGGFRYDRVPMPGYCPSYYWFDHALAEKRKLPIREHSFLTNPRTPKAIAQSTAVLHVGALAGGSAVAAADAASSSPPSDAAAASTDVVASAMGVPGAAIVPGRTSVSRLAQALRALDSARVVHVPELHRLTLIDKRGPGGSTLSLPKHSGALGNGLGEISPISSGYWCTACVTTRRGGVIQELNRSTVRELEKFCRVEARGALAYRGARQTCCGLVNGQGHPNGCPVCREGQHRVWNESTLSWHMSQWLPQWAALPEATTVAEQHRWRCLHPLCTGSDPKRFP